MPDCEIECAQGRVVLEVLHWLPGRRPTERKRLSTDTQAEPVETFMVACNPSLPHPAMQVSDVPKSSRLKSMARRPRKGQHVRARPRGDMSFRGCHRVKSRLIRMAQGLLSISVPPLLKTGRSECNADLCSKRFALVVQAGERCEGC